MGKMFNLFYHVLLLFTVGIIASPLNIGNALVTRPQNLTTNEICFLMEYGVLYGEPGWFEFSISGIDYQRQTLLRYDKSDTSREVFINHVDRGLLTKYGYDKGQDYCSRKRVTKYLNLAVKSLKGTLRMGTGPGCRAAHKKDPSEILLQLFGNDY